MRLYKWLGVLSATVLTVAVVPTAGYAQISVIVSASSSKQASEADVIDMFSGAKTTWSDGTQVQIVDQPDTEVGQQFYANFVKQSTAQVRTQWTRLVLSGQALAPQKAGDSEGVKSAVRGDPGRIGYVPTSALDSSVKELLRIN
jgi:ABC-type phosphate transport system substrate-binding protein